MHDCIHLSLHLCQLTKREGELLPVCWCDDISCKVNVMICFKMYYNGLTNEHITLYCLFKCLYKKGKDKSQSHCNSVGQSPNLCQSVC